MAVGNLSDTYLSRAAGTSVTSLSLLSADPAGYDAVLVNASVRVGGSVTLTCSGLGATWATVENRDDTQNVLQSYAFIGTGSLSSGTITITATAGTMETGAASAWGYDGDTSASPVDTDASAETGATDTNNPSVTVTPGVSDALLVGMGCSRTSDLTSAGTNYTTRMNGWSNGAGGGVLLSWVMERTASHPASGSPTAVNGTLAANREWIIHGISMKPASAAAAAVRLLGTLGVGT
jgi:hypothetical protein